MTSLAEELPKQQKRVRELVAIYDELPGGVGAFGSMMLKQALTRSEQAASFGDVIAMLRSYEELKECK